MDRKEIENKVKDIIVNILNIEESSINNDTNFINDLRADSLDGVEIIMGVEDKFEIQVSDEEAEMAISFKTMVDMMEKKIN